MASLTALTMLVLVAAPALPLPPPPPPPAPAHRLASHLVAGVLQTPGALPPASAYAVSVAVEGGPPRLGAYLADHVEAAVGRTVTGVTRVAVGDLGQTHRLSVDVRVRRASVHATARLVRLPGSFWERIREPSGQVVGTSAAAAEMDLELRILADTRASRVRLGRLRVVDVTARSAQRLVAEPVLDMAYADLDGDGLKEVVALTPQWLLTARWGAGGLTLIDTTSLRVTPPASTRLRQPAGRLVVVTGKDGALSLLVASSDRQATSLWRYGVDRWRLVDDAAGDGQWPLYALGPGAWLVRGAMTAIGALDERAIVEVEAMDKGYGERLATVTERPFHDLRVFGVFGDATPSWRPHFVMTTLEGGLTVWSAGSLESALELKGVGTSAVVCDLDANGTAELLHTSSALRGEDRLTLLELGGARRAKRQWTRTIPRPVTAMTSADLDADGFTEVLVASWEAGTGGLHIVAPSVSR